MNNKKDLEYYQLVNGCETLNELSEVIIEIGLANKGWVNGKTSTFHAQTMADNCLKLPNGSLNSLTRNYGIRQQAIYILHYQGDLQETKDIDICDVTLGDIVEFIKQMR